MYKYDLLLTLAVPRAGVVVDFVARRGDIETAIIMFNARFENRKCIDIKQISKTEIILTLEIGSIPSNPTREISAFSQILVNDFGFQEYTAKAGRLFNIRVLAKPEEDLTESEYNEIMDRYENQISKRYGTVLNEVAATAYVVDRQAPKFYGGNVSTDVFLEMSNIVLSTSSIDELENSIKQLENLLTIARAKKDILERSKEY